jgi:hypothetical protein
MLLEGMITSCFVLFFTIQQAQAQGNESIGKHAIGNISTGYIVNFALTTEENNESSVMKKVLELTKHMNQLGFKANNVVIQSEMGDMESLRLQMAMDRLSKLMSTLSEL